MEPRRFSKESNGTANDDEKCSDERGCRSSMTGRSSIKIVEDILDDIHALTQAKPGLLTETFEETFRYMPHTATSLKLAQYWFQVLLIDRLIYCQRGRLTDIVVRLTNTSSKSKNWHQSWGKTAKISPKNVLRLPALSYA